MAKKGTLTMATLFRIDEIQDFIGDALIKVDDGPVHRLDGEFNEYTVKVYKVGINFRIDIILNTKKGSQDNG